MKVGQYQNIGHDYEGRVLGCTGVICNFGHIFSGQFWPLKVGKQCRAMRPNTLMSRVRLQRFGTVYWLYTHENEVLLTVWVTHSLTYALIHSHVHSLELTFI